MSIWKLSIQNIKSKSLYTFLSVFVLALSIGLLLGIQQIKNSFKSQIDNNVGKIDLVVGAKGSPLQLVLASVLHVDNPTGNIPYEKAIALGKHSFVRFAVPISYGDNYKGYRIVGTTNEFTSLYNAELKVGRMVTRAMEVVLGNLVAEKLDLKIGDELLSSHGLLKNDINVHVNKLTVVGVLKPTQKVIDRLIISNLESIWEVHEKEENHEVGHNHDHHHNKEKEITSLLINFKNLRALLSFPTKINKETNMQAVMPSYELNKLYEYTSIGFQTITWIAYLILAISCLIICISLYKMVQERAFDLAILRTYGASNFQLIAMVFYEGIIIAFSAFITGFLMLKIGVELLKDTIASNNDQYIIKELTFDTILQTGILIFIMVVIAISLAIYPIIRMNISTILSNEK